MEKVSTITTLASRRPKLQYPTAQPTPRILHFPRRPRRKLPAKSNATKSSSQRDRKVKLETLFDQERQFATGVIPIVIASGEGNVQYYEEERRERVEERESVVVEEEKWRFQAEMLRAECNLLRMERDIAVKKMERRRALVERVLRSALQTLLSGRKRLCDGKNARIVLEEEIIEIAEKLGGLQRRSKQMDLEVQNYSNFDKQASLLQRRLEKFAGRSEEMCVKEIHEMTEASLSINTTGSISENLAPNSSSNARAKETELELSSSTRQSERIQGAGGVTESEHRKRGADHLGARKRSRMLEYKCAGLMEILKRKMGGLSRGFLLERMEVETGSVLSTANSCASSSTTISKRIEHPEMSSSSIGQPWKEERACSGCCKAIVRRVVEQVRAEREQWSQMQEMLGQVREEMEELQVSRDFWEDRALNSDYQIQSLQSAVKEWREKAVSSEAKASELQAEVSMLQAEIGRFRMEKATKKLASTSHDSPNEMEKRVLVCRLKENRHGKDDVCRQKEKKTNACSSGYINAPKRSAFREIGNSSPLPRQNNTRAVFPLNQQDKFLN